MGRIVGDIETYSEADLKKGGMARYAEHPSTDLNCLCWKDSDGVLHAWVPSASMEWAKAFFVFCEKEGFPWPGKVFIGRETPLSLRQAIEAGAEFRSWNSAFERLVLSGPAGKRYGFPTLRISQCRCSMAGARVHGLPGALEDAANAIGAPVRKRMKGQSAMRYLMKPRKDGSRPTIEEEPDRFMELTLYCGVDVLTEDAVDALVPPMTEAEQAIWEIDQEMNSRGILIDLELVDNMEVLISAYKKELDQRCRDITGIKPSRPGPLAAWIRSHGYPELENLQADTVRKILKLDIPDEVKTVLKIYGTYNAKAVMKYAAMRQAACADGRVRHMFMFYGASTGRWSSTIIQLQNLARASIADPDTAIEAAKEWDLDWMRALYAGTDFMKVAGTCVRGALMAAPGNELVFPDFAGVEARKNAWMWGEEWKLEAYRKYDQGVGANLYCVIYGKCFGVDPDSPEGKAGKGVGKVLDLSMQYEGGVGAHVKMGAQYGVDLKDMAKKTVLPYDVRLEAIDAWHYAIEQGRTYDLPEDIWIASEGQKILWRRAHPRTVAGWKELKELSIKATCDPGTVYRTRNERVMFKVQGNWLVMRLPSGRKLWYYGPRVKKDSKGRETFHYLGVNTTTRQWGVTSMYGGSWTNNLIQGSSRDLLARAKLRMKHKGLIGSVHDEPILETPIGALSDEEITQDMCGGQTWDAGLPLAVDIHRGRRYRK